MRKKYWLIFLIICVWLLIFFLFFNDKTWSSEILPKDTVAVLYPHHSFYILEISQDTPRAELDLLQSAYKHSQGNFFITAGKYITISSAAAATFFSGVAVAVPPLHPVLFITKGTAEALSVGFSALSIGVGILTKFFEQKDKIRWKDATFIALKQGLTVNLLRISQKCYSLEVRYGDSHMYSFLLREAVVGFVDARVLPFQSEENQFLIPAKVLFYRKKPFLKSKIMKFGVMISVSLEHIASLPLVVY